MTRYESVELLDESVGASEGSYTLERLLKISGHKVRVRIRRDAYQKQSYAVAELFNTELSWTTVLTSPPSNWYGTTPPRPVSTQVQAVAAGVLGSIADDLTNRMKTFLEA